MKYLLVVDGKGLYRGEKRDQGFFCEIYNMKDEAET